MIKLDKERKTLVSYTDDIATDFEDVDILCKVERRHFKKGAFYMTSFDLDSLILSNEYSAPTMRVLVALKTRLDFNNRIKTFRQIDIAEQVKTSQANVSRALRQLEDDGIIVKRDLDYYFNENFIKGAGDVKRKK